MRAATVYAARLLGGALLRVVVATTSQAARNSGAGCGCVAQDATAKALEWSWKTGADAPAKFEERHFFRGVGARESDNNIGAVAPAAEDRNLAFKAGK